MELKVSKVTDDLIFCGPWKFDRMTGAEIDEELGWGSKDSEGVIRTGSFIKGLKLPKIGS